MRKQLIFSLFIILALPLFSQQDTKLPGLVVEQNSKFNTGTVNYLSNAQVKSAGASPQRSDKEGKFTLVFADKPSGNVARIYASKSGYELVNDEVLKRAAVLDRNEPLKIVFCKEGQLYDNQVAYYKIAKDAAIKAYEQKMAILKKKGKDREILIAELQVAFNQEIDSLEQAIAFLEEQRKSVEARAKELADKFVTINLDDQSETYQRAFRAFLAKEIDLALAILDSVDLAERLAINTEEKVKEEAIIQETQKSLANRNKQIEQDINQCVFKARLHILKYEFAQAEQMYELALTYDTANVELIFELAYFLARQNQYKKSLSRHEELLGIYRGFVSKDPDLYLPGMASTLNNLANLLSANNKMNQAQLHYEEALEIYRGLATKNPKVYLPDVAMTLNNLGILFEAINKLNEAKSHYEEALKIRRELAVKNPDVYMSDVAMTINNLGLLYKANYEMTKAKDQYEESLRIFRELASRKPDMFLPFVATTLNNLANLLNDNNEIDQTQVQYEEALNIRRSLAAKNPDVYLPYVASTLNNLANLLSDNNEIEQAQEQYEEALLVFRDLARKNPDVYLPYLAGTLTNLGLFLYKNNELAQAKVQYDEVLRIYHELADMNPGVYLPYLARTFNNLGIILHKNNEMIQARVQYEKALAIYQELATENPKGYNMDLCMTAINLGLFYEKLINENEDMDLKPAAFTLMIDVEKRLAEYPQDHPTVQKYMGYVMRLSAFFETFDQAEFVLEQRFKTYQSLKKKNESEQNPIQRVVRQEQILDTLVGIFKGRNRAPELRTILADECGWLAWYQLFNQQFKEAEASAMAGLEIAPKHPNQDWLYSNLALALIFQGKLEEAKYAYLRIKDKPNGEGGTYKENFLKDLQALEDAGISHPDVKKVRKRLK